MKTREEHEYYVSNKRLYQEYKDWYAAIAVALDEGIEEPQIPAFIVESMMKIANRLSYKPNFINYTFKDDMIGDAIVDCIKYAKKFKTEKSENPFSYITTICFNAFLRRIDKEKAQKYVKAKLVAETPDDSFLTTGNDDDSAYVNQYIEFLREVGYSDDIVPVSLRRIKKEKPEISGPLSEFMPDEDE